MDRNIDATATSTTGRANPERFVDKLVKVITDPDSTDADTSEAVRLISKYGADELARCDRVRYQAEGSEGYTFTFNRE